MAESSLFLEYPTFYVDNNRTDIVTTLQNDYGFKWINRSDNPSIVVLFTNYKGPPDAFFKSNQIKKFQVVYVVDNRSGESISLTPRLRIVNRFDEEDFTTFLYKYMELNEFRDRVVQVQRQLRKNNFFTLDSYLSSLGAEAGDFTKDAVASPYDKLGKTEPGIHSFVVCYRVFDPNNNNNIDDFIRKIRDKNYKYNIVVYKVQNEARVTFESVVERCKQETDRLFVCVPHYEGMNTIDICVSEGMDLLNYEIRDRPSKNTPYTNNDFTKRTNELIVNNNINIEKYIK